MITSSALAADVTIQPAETAGTDTTPAPVNNAAPTGDSFAKLMSDTMGHQNESPSTASTTTTKPGKDDKKDKSKDLNNAGTPTALPVVAALPPPPAALAPVADATKNGQAAGAQNPADAKPDTSILPGVSAVVSSPTVSNTSKLVPSAIAPSPGKPESVASGPPTVENQSIDAIASKTSSTNMSNDDPASSHKNHFEPPSPAPSAAPGSGVTASGTGTAKQVATMKMQGKAEGSTRSAEKNLPRGSFLPADSRSDTAIPSPRAAVLPEIHAADSTTTSTAISQIVSLIHDKTGAVESSTGLESARSPQIDKVFTEISEAAVSFKRMGTDSVAVNLQPDRQTEISLHLTLANGQIEMAARVERGNFDSLNTHWADLQGSLGQQGIRVGQLEHSSLNPQGNQERNHAAFPEAMQQESGRQGRQLTDRSTDAIEEPARAAAPVAPSSVRAATATSPARRGWEVWA